MRIGELAEQAGISTKAIRSYEQVGILAPPARTASGYRAYDQAALDQAALDRLGFVRAAQAVGLTLGEIRQVIAFRDDGQAPCAHVTELLQRRAADLEVRIRQLQQLRRELRRLAERAATLDPEECPPSGCATSSPDTVPASLQRSAQRRAAASSPRPGVLRRRWDRAAIRWLGPTHRPGE
jgi:MerR family transcriptional regulator, copper efflux regulator